MTDTSLAFAPLLPWPLILGIALAALLVIGFAFWRRLGGWWLRGLGLGLLVLALAGPQLREEQRKRLPSVVLVAVDRSASTGLEDRAEAIDAAESAARTAIEALSQPGRPVELRTVEVGNASRNGGTQLLTALDEAASRTAPGQIAGALLLSDGQIHDADRIDGFPGPVHTLLAGDPDAFDLALELVHAPAFGIVGESVTFRLRAVIHGTPPPGLAESLIVQVSIDGGMPRLVQLPVGGEAEMDVEIEHGGPNVIDIVLPGPQDELTKRNNRVIAEVNGVRDRLRVLLVSGEPHPGGRTWRDLLKSDPTVSLIHFTILRPPPKQDGTPHHELSLIAFPTRELFLEKIDGFDLIIFDRYRYRQVLQEAYLDNIARYVERGGAVFIVSGAAFAGAQSLSRTPLGRIMPARPNLNVIETPFLPRVTELGQRHPVTAGLEQSVGLTDGLPRWGRWMRQVDVEPISGNVVMSGEAEHPLLMLDRVGDGRVALLASDHVWLWTRGYEGGGPQGDLLRRTAHWLMKEPELEEEALVAMVDGDRVTIERRSLAEGNPGTVFARPPEGAEMRELSFEAAGPGRWQAVLDDAEEGLWRFSNGLHQAVAAVGPPAPREYERPVASAAPLAALVAATGGRSAWLADGLPEFRMVDEGRLTHAASWRGFVDRDASQVTGIRLTPLLPAWLAALATALLFLAAWRREGRR